MTSNLSETVNILVYIQPCPPPLFKGCIEKYIDILDGKIMTKLLKSVHAGIQNKSVEDEDINVGYKWSQAFTLQDHFSFCY